VSPRGSGPTFTERARREQIVDAAVAVLAREGYAKATFARIADQAGISPGLITYHFGTRDELFAVIRQTIDQRLDAAMAGRAEGAPGYVEALQLMIVGYVAYCAENADDMLALSQLRRGAVSAGRPEVVREEREKGIGELEQMFAEGQQHGAYRRFDTRTMAVTLMTAMGATPDELHRTGVDPEVHGAELADLFAYAVAAHPSRVKRQAGRPVSKPAKGPRIGPFRFGRRTTD
jgi:AcrR family transcriptional regulator